MKIKLKGGGRLTLEEQLQSSNFRGKNQAFELQTNLQEPQLKTEGVSLSALVQKLEEKQL